MCICTNYCSRLTHLCMKLIWEKGVAGQIIVVKSPIILKNKHVINLNEKNNNKDIVYWNIYNSI